MSIEDQIRAIVEAETRQLRERIAQLEAANQRMQEPLALTVAEVAQLVKGTPESTIREWIKTGDLPAHYTPGKRTYLVYMDDLKAFLARLKAREAEPEQGQSNVRRILERDRQRVAR